MISIRNLFRTGPVDNFALPSIGVATVQAYLLVAWEGGGGCGGEREREREREREGEREREREREREGERELRNGGAGREYSRYYSS